MIKFEELLDSLIDKDISDIHFIAGVPPRIRIDSKLMDMPGQEVLTADDCKSFIYGFLTSEQIQAYEAKGEIDIAFNHKEHRFRTNVYRNLGTTAAALRWLPEKIGTFSELGLSRTVCESICEKTSGLVIVTGVTGSGKSTTLASMIEYINRTRHDHVVTIEDPVEFLHKHDKCTFSQREVGQDTESYATALRSAMRQDPDVVLVGEMRDMETIQAALNLADTGHLTFSTLHTSDAAQTINRIIDVFPAHMQQQARVQLSFVLEAVICQQLLPKAEPPGRVLVTETLMATSAVRSLIRENKVHQIYSMIQAGGHYKMHTMNQSLEDAVNNKSITYEMALTHSSDPETFAAMLKNH